MLIVRNKMDKREYEWEDLKNKKALSQQYGFKRRDFIKVSAQKAEGLEELQQCLVAKIKSMTEIQELIPKSWEEVRQKIRVLQAAGQKTLDYPSYKQYCEKAGLFLISPTSHQTLMDFLHTTGVVFYQKPLFGGQIILDQSWAIMAVYTLFKRDGIYYELLTAKKGKFSPSDLEKYWRAYSREEQALFLSFMESCEIIFGVREDGKKYETPDYYIAPQLLPEKLEASKAHLWNRGKSEQYFKYEYHFLHQGIISRFLVRVGQKAKEQAMWRHGVLLSHHQSDILIEAHYPKNKEKEKQPKKKEEPYIQIEARGPEATHLLDLVKNTLKDLHEAFHPKEWVSLNGVDWIALEALKAHPQDVAKIKTNTGKWLKYAPFRIFLQTSTQQTLAEVQLQPKDMQEYSKVETLIIDNRLAEAITALLDLNKQKNAPFRKELLAYRSRLDKLEEQLNWDIISHDKASIERNKLVNSLLNINEKLQDFKEQAVPKQQKRRGQILFFL